MYKRNLLDYFEHSVQQNGNKTAVIHGNQKVTFNELHDKCIHLADYLIEITGGILHRPICVFLPKSIDVVIGDIAITYSCNFFNNLDVQTPAPRLENIIQTLNPIAVITNTKYLRLLKTVDNIKCQIVNLDDFMWKNEYGHLEELNKRLGQQIDTDPFCIINTSGSTGTPKSVLLTHRNFIDHLNWAIDTFKLDGSEILGVMSAVVFDLYVYETCLMMARGATLVLLDKSLAAFPARLMQETRDKHVNYIFWVPTVMVNIANMGLLDKIPLPELRLVWFAGEVFPTRQFNIWKQHYPNVEFANLYGPCETSVCSTYYIVNKELQDEEPIPIGKPCRNSDVLLLNEKGQLCQEGEVGEICIRGSSLAMGYYNNPIKTKESFIQNPLNCTYPERIYKTGDLAYRNESGDLIFKGRKDCLIKHMGNRVNLGEIEHIAVDTLKLVSNCCVVYNFEKKIITMFYESNGKSILEIRKALATQMPRYMVPNEYIEIEQLPRNTNGKIDRHFLSDRVNQQN